MHFNFIIIHLKNVYCIIKNKLVPIDYYKVIYKRFYTSNLVTKSSLHFQNIKKYHIIKKCFLNEKTYIEKVLFFTTFHKETLIEFFKRVNNFYKDLIS